MKKAEELMLYTPEPQRPPLDAKLCVSVAAGEGKGRYIKGKTLTVAVWDNCKSPLAVWRFCGDYWTGVCAKRSTLPAGRCSRTRSKPSTAVHLPISRALRPHSLNPNCCRTTSTTGGRAT